MTTFELTTGILEAKVARYMQDYVVLAIEFEGLKETQYKTITKDSFDGLEKWIDDNYDLIRRIG